MGLRRLQQRIANWRHLAGHGFACVRGASLIEVLLAIAALGILLALSFSAYRWAVVAAAERRAVNHLRTMVTAQTAYYATYGQFGTWEQLIDQMGLLDGFERRLAGIAASEVIGDGWYGYSLRFESNAAGFTLDADPQMAYIRRCRRFRYRLRSTVSRRQTAMILVAPPSASAPPESAYQPFNP